MNQQQTPTRSWLAGIPAKRTHLLAVYHPQHHSTSSGGLSSVERANQAHLPEGRLVTNINVDSDEPADAVARVVRMAEQSCFAIQSMMQDTPVTATATLKGEALAY